MIKRRNNNRGLIRTIVLVIVALLIISYLGLNLRDIIDSQTFQDNWAYVKEIITSIWNNYLSGIFNFIWNNILAPIMRKIT
jgi:O-antigen/teichoic acid export membrane protein